MSTNTLKAPLRQQPCAYGACTLRAVCMPLAFHSAAAVYTQKSIYTYEPPPPLSSHNTTACRWNLPPACDSYIQRPAMHSRWPQHCSLSLHVWHQPSKSRHCSLCRCCRAPTRSVSGGLARTGAWLIPATLPPAPHTPHVWLPSCRNMTRGRMSPPLALTPLHLLCPIVRGPDPTLTSPAATTLCHAVQRPCLPLSTAGSDSANALI